METENIETARQFVRDAMQGFVKDPPDSDFQRGYLECLYVIGREALGMNFECTAAPAAQPAHRPKLRVV